MSKNSVIFILIVVLALFLRTWNLGSVPISLNWDEASWGYNSYSILNTGRDEYDKLLPLILQSFNDFKPALYAYLAIPSILILGLTNFAVRLPNALFGVISVISTYFLVKELFKRRDIALISSFLFAISPWAIQFSRYAHEGSIGVTFNILTVLFFLKGLKKPYLLIFSAIFSGMSIYAYQSEKIFAPLLMISLLLIYKKEFLGLGKKYILSFIFVGLLVVLPMALSTVLTPNSLNRINSTNITNDIQFSPFTPHRIEIDRENKDYLGLIIDNRRIVYTRQIIGAYLSHFDPNWLFIKGDQPRHHAPGMGLMYLWELPFLLIGIYSILFNTVFSRKSKKLIFTWLLIAFVPAAITLEVPHAGRTLNVFPIFQILTAAGILASYNYLKLNIKNKYIKLSIYFIFAFVVIFNFMYFLNQYFVQQNYFNSKDWQYGWGEAVTYANSVSKEYEKIVVSNESPLDQSYMFFLYHLKYSPKNFNNITRTIDNHNFERFEFRRINWNEDSKLKDTLFIGRPGDFGNGEIIKTIKYLDGEEAIKIVIPD